MPGFFLVGDLKDVLHPQTPSFYNLVKLLLGDIRGSPSQLWLGLLCSAPLPLACRSSSRLSIMPHHAAYVGKKNAFVSLFRGPQGLTRPVMAQTPHLEAPAARLHHLLLEAPAPPSLAGPAVASARCKVAASAGIFCRFGKHTSHWNILCCVFLS
jgi:hypothetical protein